MILEFICRAIYLFLVKHFPSNLIGTVGVKTICGFVVINETNTDSYEQTLLRMVNTLILYRLFSLLIISVTLK